MSTTPKPTPETPTPPTRPPFRQRLGRVLMTDRRGARRAAATAAMVQADVDALREEVDSLANQAKRLGAILDDLAETLAAAVILSEEPGK